MRGKLGMIGITSSFNGQYTVQYFFLGKMAGLDEPYRNCFT